MVLKTSSRLGHGLRALDANDQRYESLVHRGGNTHNARERLWALTVALRDAAGILQHMPLEDGVHAQ